LLRDAAARRAAHHPSGEQGPQAATLERGVQAWRLDGLGGACALVLQKRRVARSVAERKTDHSSPRPELLQRQARPAFQDWTLQAQVAGQEVQVAGTQTRDLSR